MPKRIIQLLFTTIASLLLSACGQNNSFQGYIEGEYSYIASAVSGNLTQLLVNRGDRVKANQPLFVLDPQPESDKLQQAKFTLQQVEQEVLDLKKGQRETIIKSLEAMRSQAVAALDFSQKTLDRYQELYKVNAIDKATVDQIKSLNDTNIEHLKETEANIAEAKLGARENLIKAREAAVISAEANVKQAKWALLQKSIRSPVTGQIFDTLYTVGEFVNATSPVIVLLPPNKIKVIFYLPEKVVSKIKIDDFVSVNCDGCNKKYHAKISFISPKAEYTPPVIFSKESREKLVFRIEAYPAPEEAVELHPGQPVDVTITQKD